MNVLRSILTFSPFTSSRHHTAADMSAGESLHSGQQHTIQNTEAGSEDMTVPFGGISIFRASSQAPSTGDPPDKTVLHVEDGEVTASISTSANDAQNFQSNDNTPPSQFKPKVCFYWYHHGTCTRDPATISGQDRPCPFLHQIPADKEGVKLSFATRKAHGELGHACGLELCRYKDSWITSLPSAPIDETPASHQPKQRKLNKDSTTKVCFHWYHHGKCTRDPATASGEDHTCRYLHEMPMDDKPIKISTAPRWMHKEACGLELCPWKDHAYEDQRIKKPTQDGGKTPKEENQDKDNTPSQSLKRKFYHPDEPTGAPKRTKIDYDDTQLDRIQMESEQTCFFWYHGIACKRSQDPRDNYKCPMKHEMTSPPSMVQTPPGYAHKTACELSWCSGNRMVEKASSQNRDGGKEASIGGHESERKQRRKEIDETCFFWYHGSCKRTQDARRNFQCGMKHGLANPPTMVQPPPGYVHKEPCGLPWCPGDSTVGKEVVAAQKRKKYTRKGKKKPLIHRPKVEDDDRADSVVDDSDAASTGEPPPEREEWFLKGFEEI